MKHGLFFPNFGPFGDPDSLVELALDAERSGWDGFFLWDAMLAGGPAETGPVVDSWIALTVVAAATNRLRLGTLITPLARRRPWKLARETTTLDHVSKGRVVLGVAIGGEPEQEYGTFGEDTDARLRADRLDEALEVVDGLWSGTRVQFEGDHYRVNGAEFAPRPVQRPRIPVWCGGWWPNRRPFRRAARWDGVAPELYEGATPSPADVEEIRDYVFEHRDREQPFDIVVNGYSGPEHPDLSIADYERAGATWWLERFEISRLFSVPAARDRILAGPHRDVA